jgi:hypothetical protein
VVAWHGGVLVYLAMEIGATFSIERAASWRTIDRGRCCVVWSYRGHTQTMG